MRGQGLGLISVDTCCAYILCTHLANQIKTAKTRIIQKFLFRFSKQVEQSQDGAPSTDRVSQNTTDPVKLKCG